MKRVVGWMLLTLVACSTNTVGTSRDSGAADLWTLDAEVRDATLAADVVDATVRCTVTADGPRALLLRGRARYFRDAGAPAPMTLDETRLLFLPRGRSPDAPLLVGFNNYAGSFVEVPASFEGNAGLAGLYYSGIDSSDVAWTASMSAPDGPLTLQLSRNLNTVTDVRDEWQGEATLCPEGDAPAPTLRPLLEVGPVGPWRLGANAPVAAGADTITLRANDMRVEVSARWESGWLTLTPARSVAPGSELALDVSGVRDPVGRVFSVEGAVRVLETTAAVSDLAFDVAPPAGAVVGGRAQVREGALELRSDTGRIGPYVSLIALGETAAGPVTLRYQTRFGDTRTFTAWLVRADGTRVSLPIESGAPSDPLREAQSRVEGSGPLWLQVTDHSAVHRPGWLPRSPPVFVIDEVRVGM